MALDKVSLDLPIAEARALYVHLHQTPRGQDLFEETYLQLQRFFFQNLTIEELTCLLGPSP